MNEKLQYACESINKSINWQKLRHSFVESSVFGSMWFLASFWPSLLPTHRLQLDNWFSLTRSLVRWLTKMAQTDRPPTAQIIYYNFQFADYRLSSISRPFNVTRTRHFHQKRPVGQLFSGQQTQKCNKDSVS